MAAMLWKTGARALRLIRQVVLPSRFPGPVPYLQRLLVLSLLLPPLLLLQLVHWAGFLLDEILFRGYRRIEVQAPIFVLGVPRSGTTFMHRLLACDAACTTLSTRECLLAPSVTERYVWLGIAALDRRLGRPLHRLGGALGRLALGWIGKAHPTSLDAPEEDYLTFLPLLCCFILVLPFPEADWVWRMGRFDREVPPRERAWLLRWYRRCLQRHLYVHGADKTMLSKNASFAGMAAGLAATFPDCRLVVCERDALDAVRSQFHSLAAGMRLFAVREDDPEFRGKLLDCLDFYYRHLDAAIARHDDARVVRVALEDLSDDPRRVIEAIYSRFGRQLPIEIDRALGEYESRGRPWVPARPPPLSAWGIDAAAVARRFAPWRQKGAARP